MNLFEEILLRLNILWANTVYTYRIQTAYFFENWAGVASTLFYVLTQVLFIKVIYSNVTYFAGYNENDMLFLVLVRQAYYYSQWVWSIHNIESMVEIVRSGELDLILAKPVPSLFYITFRDISLINRIKDGVPNLLLIAVLIDWSNFTTTSGLLLIGFVIFICGQISWHCFRFIFALPVFFVGQSQQIFQLSGSFEKTNDIPLEGFPLNLRRLFMSFIPTLIAAQMTVSVILGKSDPLQMLLVAISITVVFLILKQVGWIIALRSYSSASS